MATFSPSRKTLPSTGGNFNLTLTLTTSETTATNWDIEYYDSNEKQFIVSIITTGTTSCGLSILSLPNPSTIDIHHTFYVVKFSNSVTPVRYRYSFTVQHNYANTIKPIWKDVECYSENTNVQYTIYNEDNEPIYRGNAIAEPNNNRTIINVNKICSQYLSSALQNHIQQGFQFNYDYVKLFTIKEKTDSVTNETPLAQYRFYNSYGYGSEPSRVFNSDPIKRSIDSSGNMIIKIDRRQYNAISAFNDSSAAKQLTLKYVKGGVINDHYTVVLDNTAEYIGFERNIYYDSPLISSLFYVTSDSKDMVINVNIVDTCYDYCLYYCNAYGGWDSLLIGGNAVKTDKIDSKYFNSHFNNTTQDFERRKYANVITTEYKLYTDWFNDDEQSRLHHLLESTQVYLHNLNTDEILPVNLTNNECVYKTFTNNGRKKWYNTFNATVAQTKIRR